MTDRGEPRNIVLCLDGTGNAYGSANTNVVKLYNLLEKNDVQYVYYDPGVGTFSADGAWTTAGKWLTRMLGLAFAFGMARSMAQAYLFIQRHFRPGDRVFIFGFSRGAYCARATAGLLNRCWLLRTDLKNLVPYAIALYKKERSREVISGFRNSFSQRCPVAFLGLWDTVSSVGWIWNPKTLPFTRSNSSVKVVRHAVAIDERRAFYRTNRWTDKPGPKQDVLEVFFSGVHSDVGGSYPDTESGLAQIALRWMALHAADAGLLIDRKAWKQHFHASTAVKANPLAQSHRSLKGLWWIVELCPKFFNDPAKDFRRTIRINFGRRRFVPADARIHWSVRDRMNNSIYDPPNLPKGVKEDCSDQLLSAQLGLL